MCMSRAPVQQAPIQRAPQQVASNIAEEEKPIELVTADQDVKKKKKKALAKGTTQLNTGMNTATAPSDSGVSYSA